MSVSVPPGKQTFFDPETGALLALGTVTHYIPTTTTFKNTWADEAQTQVNANPILLDGTGSCSIWGSGLYRQILRDQFGNEIWDRVTGFDDSAAGVGVTVVESKVVATATRFPTAQTFLSVAGDTTAADGGSGDYIKVGAPPAYPGYFQSADGAYWDFGKEPVNAFKFGYSETASASINATAILNAIERAMALDSYVIIPAISATVGALGALPTSGVLRIVFEPGAELTVPGAGVTALSDVTFAAPTVSTYISGHGTFVGYRRVFDFDNIAAGMVIEAEGLTFVGCGRVYDYTGAADRQDYTPAFGCRPITASTIQRLTIRDFHAEDRGGIVCDFAVVWRSGLDQASVDGISTNGLSRMLIMLGDNSTWFTLQNIVVQNLTALNIYPRNGATTETECHGFLLYGRRIVVDGFNIQNVYDTKAAGSHDTEGGYLKSIGFSVSNGNLYNAGRGDGFLSFKGFAPTTAELYHTETLTTYNGVAAFGVISNVTVMMSDTFAAFIGSTDAIYSIGTRLAVANVKVIGSFDRGIEINGCARVSDVEVFGNMTYGVFNVPNPDDPVGSRFSNIYCEGAFSGAGLEYRNQGTLANLTIPELTLENVKIKLTENGQVAGAGLISVRCDPSNFQNRISRIMVTDCSGFSERTTNHMGALAFYTNVGALANEGIIDNININNLSQSACNWWIRFSATAGKIVSVNVLGGQSLSPVTSQFSNPTVPTKLKVRGMVGTLDSEQTGTATVAAGATTQVVTYPVAFPGTLGPTTLNNIRITPGPLGAATKWWVTAITNTQFQMNVDVAPGGAGFLFGWEACNRFY